MNKQKTTFDPSLNPLLSASFDEAKYEYDEDLIHADFRQSSKGKHIQTFSARVLDWNENSVKTEWLINKEEGKYQVRNFPKELFDCTNFLEHGHRLKVFLFVKCGEMRMSFQDGSNLVSEKDFPESNLLKGIDSKLFKFK